MSETTTNPMNGHEKLIGIKVVDPTPEAVPVSSQVHDLLIESVGKIADEWVLQLTTLRNSANELEQQILTYVSRTRHDISALHDLGIKVATEAARGQAVCKELKRGLEKIS